MTEEEANKQSGCGYGCYIIGGPWISYNPNCPKHGTEARAATEKAMSLELQPPTRWNATVTSNCPESAPPYRSRPSLASETIWRAHAKTVTCATTRIRQMARPKQWQ